MSQSGSYQKNIPAGMYVETLTGDNNTVHVPPDGSGNINIVGAAGEIIVTGDSSTNTLTISVDNVATQYDTDNGTAVPEELALNIKGGSNIATSAVVNPPNTVTINVSGTTAHAIQIGNVGQSLTSLGVATNGQIPIGSSANDPVLATITAGSGITVTNGPGSITIAASGTGVTSITGTANEITASAATGAVTLSTPSTFIAPGSIAATTTVTATSGNITATSGNFALTAATTASVGQITQAGTSIFHTFGTRNTFAGAGAGNFTLSGFANVGIGSLSPLSALTSGGSNCAVGDNAGASLNSGSENCFYGENSGASQTSSDRNTFLGYTTGHLVSTGTQNVMVGAFSTTSGTFTGNGNCWIGHATGNNYTTSETDNILIGRSTSGTVGESNVLRIGSGTGTGTGNLNAAYISGITGITVTGTAVLVSAANQLGVAVSSRKYKDNIQDMGSSSEDIYKLRPTTFNYKESTETRYGLIAEEVHEIYPELVVYDKNGDPQTVMYHELPALLLNEIQKLRKEIDALKGKL